MAWPKLWPKFKSWRAPVSRSSASTSRRLQSTQAKIISAVTGSPRSMDANSASSAIIPYFTASAIPSARTDGSSVDSSAVSATTAAGCQNTPARFLPAVRSTPVLPPTDESIIASSVVGIWITRTPRR